MDVTDTINQLRTLADWLEATPLPEDVHPIVRQSGNLSLFCYSTEAVRTCRRLVGRVDKREGSGSYPMVLEGTVEGVSVWIWPPADTCKRVQVGTETRTREEPVETRTVTEEVPVYEWDCGPVLADEPEAVPA